jgi:hypothetical protein
MKDILLVAGLMALPSNVSHRPESAGITVKASDPRLRRLEQFFAKRDCPLREAAADFLIAADQNALDWRLLPSISIIESSGGKDYRNNNVFGWDSCRESFSSVRAGIHFVAAQLGHSKRYRDKTLDKKLQTYNPNPDYPHKVKAVMRALAPAPTAALVAAQKN